MFYRTCFIFTGLLVCQTTESLTDKEVNLRENVTLDCQIGRNELYWVFQKLTDSPVLILRTFTTNSGSSFIQDQRLKDKYSTLTSSRLFISNITINELGIYYCVTRNQTLQISDGIRLYINGKYFLNTFTIDTKRIHIFITINYLKMIYYLFYCNKSYLALKP